MEGLKDLLDGPYLVHIATSAEEGLQLLRQIPNIAIVMSDMRMPILDGAAFLQQARTVASHAVRMLLTGYGDMDSAMAAVNKGQIFRFLTKPWTPDALDQSFTAALEQYRLQTAEKVLLPQTLMGFLKALMDVLAVVEPIAFGRGQRITGAVTAITHELRLDNAWAIEAAALLCQLGGMSDVVLIKLYDGEPLDESDEREVATGIANACKLLDNIPRLEPVPEILRGLPRANGDAGPLGSRILRVAIDFDAPQAQGYGARQALDALNTRGGRYDTSVLDALRHSQARRSADRASRCAAHRQRDRTHSQLPRESGKRHHQGVVQSACGRGSERQVCLATALHQQRSQSCGVFRYVAGARRKCTMSHSC